MTKLLTIDEVAERLGGVSPGLVRKQIRSGRLPAVQIGRCVRVEEADVDAFVQSCKVAAREAACSTSEDPSGGSSSSTAGASTVSARVLRIEEEQRHKRVLSALKSRSAAARLGDK